MTDAEALGALERALTLAEPEGYVRVFVGEGAPMAALLERPGRTPPGWAYLRQLLDARSRRATHARRDPRRRTRSAATAGSSTR